MKKELKYQLTACASVLFFIAAEVNYDLHPDLNMVYYWFLPLSIMFLICSFCFFKLTKYKGVKLFCWLLFSMDSNWIMRFICNYKNETMHSEYWWIPMFVLGGYLIVYKKKKPA